MSWKLRQLKREEKKESIYYNLTLSSIGYFISNYDTDKILRDALFNLLKKILINGSATYLVKFYSLPDDYEVSEKIEEFENDFKVIHRRIKK